MAKTPIANARPTADGVDPATPLPGTAPTPAPDGTTKQQTPETLGQVSKPLPDNPAAEDATALTVNETSPNLTKEDDDRALPGNGATEAVEMVKVKTKEHIILMDPFSAKSIGIKGAEVPVTSFINDELAEGGRLEKA